MRREFTTEAGNTCPDACSPCTIDLYSMRFSVIVFDVLYEKFMKSAMASSLFCDVVLSNISVRFVQASAAVRSAVTP